MSKQIKVTVQGVPVPQGSKVAYPNKRTGKPILVETGEKKLKPWRANVVAAIMRSRAGRIEGPVRVDLVFRLPRPLAHYGTGRNHGTIKPRFKRKRAASKPDIDKVTRAIHDAITDSGAVEDDARITASSQEKHYVAIGEKPGVDITITELGEDYPEPSESEDHLQVTPSGARIVTKDHDSD